MCISGHPFLGLQYYVGGILVSSKTRLLTGSINGLSRGFKPMSTEQNIIVTYY